ncbi:MAG: MerR family transcriptional regulator [Spirochaetota bacterium]
MKSYTIGQLAKQAGVGVETIRFYEKKGLIEQPLRMDSEYRRYSENFLHRIRLIKQAQSLGFTLKEIQSMLNIWDENKPNDPRAKSICDQKVKEIDEKIQALQEIRELLLERQSRCNTANDT